MSPHHFDCSLRLINYNYRVKLGVHAMAACGVDLVFASFEIFHEISWKILDFMLDFC